MRKVLSSSCRFLQYPRDLKGIGLFPAITDCTCSGLSLRTTCSSLSSIHLQTWHLSNFRFRFCQASFTPALSYCQDVSELTLTCRNTDGSLSELLQVYCLLLLRGGSVLPIPKLPGVTKSVLGVSVQHPGAPNLR